MPLDQMQTSRNLYVIIHHHAVIDSFSRFLKKISINLLYTFSPKGTSQIRLFSYFLLNEGFDKPGKSSKTLSKSGHGDSEKIGH